MVRRLQAYPEHAAWAIHGMGQRVLLTGAAAAAPVVRLRRLQWRTGLQRLLVCGHRAAERLRS
jgi:hypothetical protein